MKVTYLHFDFQSQPQNCRLLLTSETYIRVLMALHLGYKKKLFRYMVGFCYAKLTANY